MRVLRLVIFFALSLCANSYEYLAADRAYAGCCMCGSCDGSCTCPGVGRCKWCAGPAPTDLQVTSPFSDQSSQSATVTLPSLAINSRNADHLIRRIGAGQCPSNKLRLNVFSNDEGVRRAEPVFFENYSQHENMVALRVASSSEK
jgi:hypothetical protein